jgi:hypothetical protein
VSHRGRKNRGQANNPTHRAVADLAGGSRRDARPRSVSYPPSASFRSDEGCGQARAKVGSSEIPGRGGPSTTTAISSKRRWSARRLSRSNTARAEPLMGVLTVTNH